MSTIEQVVDNILTHYGVKGMRWGIRRKATVGPQEIVISDRRKKLKSRGGEGHPAHSDAVRAQIIGQKGKKSGFKSLSDQELSDYSRRLQLEQNAKRLEFNQKSRGKKFVASVLGQAGKQQVNEVTNRATSAAVKAAITRAAVLAAA